jgi:hypothetical protein
MEYTVRHIQCGLVSEVFLIVKQDVTTASGQQSMIKNVYLINRRKYKESGIIPFFIHMRPGTPLCHLLIDNTNTYSTTSEISIDFILTNSVTASPPDSKFGIFTELSKPSDRWSTWVKHTNVMESVYDIERVLALRDDDLIAFCRRFYELIYMQILYKLEGTLSGT